MSEWKKSTRNRPWEEYVYDEPIVIFSLLRGHIRIYKECTLYSDVYKTFAYAKDGRHFYTMSDKPFVMKMHTIWCHEGELPKMLEVLNKYLTEQLEKNEKTYIQNKKRINSFLLELEELGDEA